MPRITEYPSQDPMADDDLFVTHNQASGATRSVERLAALRSLPGDELVAGTVSPNKLVSGSGTSWTWQSWTPTITGFSANPSGGVYLYTQIGKTVFISIRQPNNGTSNATGFTITLPVTAKTTTDQTWEVWFRGVNNGNLAFPRLGVISSGGTVIDLYSDAAQANWVNSGGKRVVSLQMFYEAA